MNVGIKCEGIDLSIRQVLKMVTETKENPEIKAEIPIVKTSEESGDEEIISDIVEFAEDFKKQMNEGLTKLIGNKLEEISKEKTSTKSVEEIIPDIVKFAEDFKKQMNEDLRKLIEITSSRIKNYEKWVEREKKEKTDGIKNANKSTMANLMAPLTRLYNVNDIEDEEIISLKKMFDNFCKDEGIKIILPSKNEKFDESFHHTAETSETEDEQQNNKIVNVIRIGCLYTSGNVIVPAEVIVYKKKKIEGE